MSVPLSDLALGEASSPGPERDPRPGRRLLFAAGGVFLAAAAFSLFAAGGLLSGLGRDAATLSQELDAARYRAQPAFNEKVSGARDAAAQAGWGLGPSAPLPNFECWQQADQTACDLFAHADGEAPIPVAAPARTAAIDQLVAVTNAELAKAGWRCTPPLTSDATATVVTDCTAGTATLRVSLNTGVPAGPALTQTATDNLVQLRIDVSDRAYRSVVTTG